jgi:hypothetical protein
MGFGNYYRLRFVTDVGAHCGRICPSSAQTPDLAHKGIRKSTPLLELIQVLLRF